MAWEKLGDACIATGNKKDGSGKYWTKLGSVWHDPEKPDDISIVLECPPPFTMDERTGYPRATIKVFKERRDGQGGGRPQRQSRPPQQNHTNEGPDDDVPF